MKFYNYVFYNIYKSFLRLYNNDDPIFKAIMFLSIIDFLYLANVISLLDFFGIRISIGNVYIVGILVVAPFMVVNYFLFVYKDRYEEIKRSFDKEPFFSITITRLLIILFFLIPVIGLITLIYLNKHK